MLQDAMPQETPTRRFAFTAAEIRTLRIYAVVCAVIGAGLVVVVPKGPGQVLAALFTVLLLPIPALVIYFRRRKDR